MFYPVPVTETEPARPGSGMLLVSLTPAESKRLIAKGVAALPEVRRALEKGIIYIARGTTNAFVVEELLGQKIELKAHYAAGVITEGQLNANGPQTRMRPIVVKQGQVMKVNPVEALKEFRGEDVLIKGGNAVDPEGNAGVLAAGDTGGTIGEALPILLPRGSYLISPIGLEKLIPSVAEASRKTGIFRYKYSTGLPAGLVPLVNALVVTEIQAFQLLTGVRAYHVSSGGIDGSEGSVVLSIEGSEAAIERALVLVKSVKGEPPVKRPASLCAPPAASVDFDALTQWQALNPLPRPS